MCSSDLPGGAGQPPVGWVQAPARQGGVTILAKLGALILFLWGLLFTALGGLAIALGAQFKGALESVVGAEALTSGVGNAIGGAIVVVGVVVIVGAVIEMLVGIFAWRGSGFARVMGILYGLFFGGLGVMGILGTASAGSSLDELGVSAASPAIGQIIFTALYLYPAIVFILAYRSKA